MSTFFTELDLEDRFYGFFRRLAGFSETKAHQKPKKLLKSPARNKFSYIKLYHRASSIMHPLMKPNYIKQFIKQRFPDNM